MKRDYLNKDFIYNVSYLQYLLYQDNYYTIDEIEQIQYLIDKLIHLLERK